jgi:uncharacterized protein YidB (DUF937 family)
MGLLEDVIGGVLDPKTKGQGAPAKGGMSPMMMAMMAFLAYRALSGRKGGAAASPAPGSRGAAPDAAPGGGGGLGDILGDILGGGQARGASPGGTDARVPGGGGGGLGDILGDILGGGQPRGASPGGAGTRVPGGGGGLGDILGQILGGGGRSGGGGPPSGLDELSDIVERFDKNGHGDAARSWVGRGDNKPVAPDQMTAVLDENTLDQLQAATGLDREELLAGMAQTLPGVVDRLTPNGRMPTPQEWQRFER